MFHSFQNLIERLKPKNPCLVYYCILLSSILMGSCLVLLYLPLPSTRIPVATEVYDIHHNLAATFYSQNRRPAKLSQIPLFLRQAFLAVEDHRFYLHKGINPGRILKAAWYNLRHGKLAQGASTITQQLAKNTYLNQDRNFTRKLKELFYTIKLEMEYSKDKIFELYLNQIYFGHGAYGVKVAAETYFQKDLDQLNEAEMALLAGLPRGPAFYSPYTHPRAARQRLRITLLRMLECGYISRQQYESYVRQPLVLPGLKTRNNTAPYFLDLLQKEMARLFPGDPELLYNAGLKIESTLDLKLHNLAIRALKKGLPRLYHDRHGLIQPQGVLIAIDPDNGEIRTLIGGTDYAKSQFNRAVSAWRQPGSAFKPLVYAAAMSNGFTLASVFDRSPKTYYTGAKAYRPTDYTGPGTTGKITLREALACSSNVVAVKLLEKLGFDPVIKLTSQLGFSKPLTPLLSIALGTWEVTPLELTAAYLPFANGGLYYRPTTIRRVLDRQGLVLYQAAPKSNAVIDPGVSFLITQALTGVFKANGTAANIGSLFQRPVAGKTGTTDRNRDAWFIGYTPELLACVFIGCDHNERTLPGTANRVAAPIWADFMRSALADQPPREFPIPKNIRLIDVCQSSGAIATASCPRHSEFFLAGTEPKTYCSQHRFIQIKVCKLSGQLPGPYCTRFETKVYPLGEAPNAICDRCKEPTGLIHLFRRLFRRIKAEPPNR